MLAHLKRGFPNAEPGLNSKMEKVWRCSNSMNFWMFRFCSITFSISDILIYCSSLFIFLNPSCVTSSLEFVVSYILSNIHLIFLVFFSILFIFLISFSILSIFWYIVISSLVFVVSYNIHLIFSVFGSILFISLISFSIPSIFWYIV